MAQESVDANRTLEDRIRAIEDRLEIYNLIASHPPSADTAPDRGAARGAEPRRFDGLSHPPRRRQPLGARAQRRRLEDQAPHRAHDRRLGAAARNPARRADIVRNGPLKLTAAAAPATAGRLAHRRPGTASYRA